MGGSGIGSRWGTSGPGTGCVAVGMRASCVAIVSLSRGRDRSTRQLSDHRPMDRVVSAGG